MGKAIATKRILYPIMVISILLLGACGSPTVSEFKIPANYTTYTDEAGLFSISHPSNWELIDDTSVGDTRIVLFGRPKEELPTVFVTIIPESTKELSEWVDILMMNSEQNYGSEFHEFSRIEAVIDEKGAIVVDYETGDLRELDMFLIEGTTGWCISCYSASEEFSNWEEDFQTIVRSLRILK